jgi:four helix bundle protein
VDSVPRNIAEGFGRYGDREFARFVEIGYASLLETYTNLLLARDRRFMSLAESERLLPLYEEAKATTLGLLKCLKRRIAAQEGERPRRRNRST